MSVPDPSEHPARPGEPLPAAPAPRSGRRRLALLAGGVVAAGAVAWGASRAFRVPGPRVLPDIAYPLIDGRRLGADALRGRVVLVNFWATSCAICVAEMPELTAVYEAYRPRGLELLAIAMPYDRPDHVLHFAATRALPFPVALDPVGAAVIAWGGVEGTPITWLVAPDGRIVRRWLGRPDFARLRRDVEALLPRPAA